MDKLKIGFLVSEYFGYKAAPSSSGGLVPTNNHGGFGYLARVKAEALTRMGHEVQVFVPSYTLLPEEEESDGTRVQNGVTIRKYHVPYEVNRRLGKILWKKLVHGDKNDGSKRLDEILAEEAREFDVFHSEEPLDYTLTALKYNPRQLMIFQDPYDDEDIALLKESRRQFRSFGGLKLRIIENDYVINNAYEGTKNAYRTTVSQILRVAKSSSVFSEAHFIGEKTRKMFNLNYTPAFLPNPTVVPDSIPKKSKRPLILWLGRWDPIKRVQLALDVASRSPEYDFHFVGVPTKNRFILPAYNYLSGRYERYPNINVRGFISEEEKESLLRDAWVLMNTSFREGLPITFLEAAAHGMSIVSSVNPDGWSSRFGKYITGEENFSLSLKKFMESEDPLAMGKKAYEHVKEIHSLDKVMQEHIHAYGNIIENSHN